MTIVGVIPARLGSTRFPGKPLAKIAGIPMIEHVYMRCRLCNTLDHVLVATCDEAIAEATECFGGDAVMTSPAHERASDRVAEVAAQIDADIFVMIQGDEPLIVPEMIDLALQPILEEESVLCTNLVAPIRSDVELRDPSTIKVVIGHNGDALYMSRSPIPFHVNPEPVGAFKQVCVIPFRRDFLLCYAELEPTPLERAEAIDMLRVLEHGFPIRTVHSPFETQAVDTVPDLALVRKLMREDVLIRQYARAESDVKQEKHKEN